MKVDSTFIDFARAAPAQDDVTVLSQTISDVLLRHGWGKHAVSQKA
jgi:hypothetical protein